MKVLTNVLAGVMSVLLLTASAFAEETNRQVFFTNVHIFNGESEARTMNANLLVEGSLIKRLRPRKP
jgi:hypothetical protein